MGDSSFQEVWYFGSQQRWTGKVIPAGQPILLEYTEFHITEDDDKQDEVTDPSRSHLTLSLAM